MSDGSTTYVICIRDPDTANDFQVLGPANVDIIDVDLGIDDLSDARSFLSWAEGILCTYDAIPQDKYDEVRGELRGIIMVQCEKHDHPWDDLTAIRRAISITNSPKPKSMTDDELDAALHSALNVVSGWEESYTWLAEICDEVASRIRTKTETPYA